MITRFVTWLAKSTTLYLVHKFWLSHYSVEIIIVFNSPQLDISSQCQTLLAAKTSSCISFSIYIYIFSLQLAIRSRIWPTCSSPHRYWTVKKNIWWKYRVCGLYRALFHSTTHLTMVLGSLSWRRMCIIRMTSLFYETFIRAGIFLTDFSITVCTTMSLT